MSILGHRGLFLRRPPLTYIGNTTANGTGSALTMNYPAGSEVGDLIVLICHFGNATYSASAPWTSAFSTGIDQYNYNWQVYWRIKGAETNIAVSTHTGYEYTIVTIRGASSVSSTDWLYTTNINAGATANTVLPYAGHTIALISDRGAGGNPTLSSTGRTNTWTNNMGTYFRQQAGLFLNHASGLTISYTDLSDTYHSSGLRFRVL